MTDEEQFASMAIRLITSLSDQWVGNLRIAAMNAHNHPLITAETALNVVADELDHAKILSIERLLCVGHTMH